MVNPWWFYEVYTFIPSEMTNYWLQIVFLPGEVGGSQGKYQSTPKSKCHLYIPLRGQIAAITGLYWTQINVCVYLFLAHVLTCILASQFSLKNLKLFFNYSLISRLQQLGNKEFRSSSLQLVSFDICISWFNFQKHWSSNCLQHLTIFFHNKLKAFGQKECFSSRNKLPDYQKILVSI